jgi:hypothetical protein
MATDWGDVGAFVGIVGALTAIFGVVAKGLSEKVDSLHEEDAHRINIHRTDIDRNSADISNLREDVAEIKGKIDGNRGRK